MKIFVASVVTETNSFAPTPTGADAFEPYGDRALETLERLAVRDGHSLVVGPMLIAQPSGPTVGTVYERMRERLLCDLSRAEPVDAVVLLLHGAMVADGYPDCEGDLLEHVRRSVGPRVAIGVELDLHCHFTESMRRNADIIIAYKEYPHVDVLDRLGEVWDLTLATVAGRIAPTTSVVDCRMVNLWPTTQEPMASFVEHMRAMERVDGVLSVSFGHGFPWGDVAEAGAKVWVITDGDADLAVTVAEELARAVWSMRDRTRTRAMPVAAAIDRIVASSTAARWVVADVADNPGGGAAGDSTFVLRELVRRGVSDVAIGAYWDPGAIQVCGEAGVGATFTLRVGGKCGPASGDPLDLRVTVRCVREAHRQADVELGSSDCGRSVWIATDEGIDLVLVSRRQQVMGTDLFSGLGIDLPSKRVVVVKSSQHFHAAFAPLADEVLYVNTPGLLRDDFENLPYRHRDLNFWPRVEDPFAPDCDASCRRAAPVGPSGSCHGPFRSTRLSIDP